MKKILLLLIPFLFLLSCSNLYKEESILWYWKWNNEYLRFSENGKLSFLKWTWSYLSEVIQPENAFVSYEIIEEVTPHQIYLIFTKNKEEKRIPFWIYKIENDKLIINKSKEFHKTLWSIDMWISRYELPIDFSWELDVYFRLKEIPEVKGIYYDWKFYKDIQEQEDEEIKNIFSWK
ncbi:MAG: hypothetical protein ACD_71C00163G0002 [uncultured bacterium (gcode 4)]|uniref:Lipoprotein n=1 Tax=uncultured bacterium (gcode 4) TaxID=1234023 RepID=K1ZIV1_9BACT|nr:MAG: hypothetical protein ACD_71C00163G0002 [uncultured bacterium (gcode 4)]